MSYPFNKIIQQAITLTVGLLMVESSFAEPMRVTVQIENTAPMQGTFMTPVWIGLHDGVAFDTYNGNTAASSRPRDGSLAMETLCEDGATEVISEDFSALQPNSQQSTASGPNGPLAPGEMTEFTFIVDSDDEASRYFSYASMVLPSNDFCVSNGNPKAHEVFDEEGNFVAESFFAAGNETLDAGTEINDEVPANTAFFGQIEPNTGLTEGSTIGTLGSDRLDVSGFLPRGSGGILDDEQFREGDFALNGYSFLKFKFTAEPAITEELFFSAFLRGRNEVPAVRTRTIALAQVNLVDDGAAYDVRAAVARLPRDVPIVAAHLHLGAEGENGPVIADLLTNSQFSGRRIRHLAAQLTEADLVGPLAGRPLDALTAAIQAGNVYVNIHTPRNPAGEVRGQLSESNGRGY